MHKNDLVQHQQRKKDRSELYQIGVSSMTFDASQSSPSFPIYVSSGKEIQKKRVRSMPHPIADIQYRKSAF